MMNQQGPTTPQRINAYPVLAQQQQGNVMVGGPSQQSTIQQQQAMSRPLQPNPNNAAVFNNNVIQFH